MSWTIEQAERQIEERGYVVNNGQLAKVTQRHLEKLAKRGAVIKRRGHWDDPLGHRGFGLGPMKTIYVRADQVPA